MTIEHATQSRTDARSAIILMCEYAITNLNATQTFTSLCRYANACGLQHGKDQNFEPLDATDETSEAREAGRRVSGDRNPRDYGCQEARFFGMSDCYRWNRAGVGELGSKCFAFGIRNLFGW